MISYYGYWQTNKSDENYVTTQMMIWEARGWIIDEAPSYYREKKQKVQDKINTHSLTPSFDNYSGKQVTVNTTLKLSDTNGVLQYYLVSSGYPNENTHYSKDGVNFYWSGNDLFLTPTIDAVDNFSMNFRNVSDYSSGIAVAFINGSKQKLSPVDKISDPSYSKISFQELKYGKMDIFKQDEDGTYISNTSFSLSYNAYMSYSINYITSVVSTILADRFLL